MTEIVTAPAEVLAKQAKLVGKIDKDILACISEMKEALIDTRDPEGVGLAAPQIGSSLRMFIMRPTLKAPITVCINPVMSEVVEPVTEKKPTKRHKNAVKLEGCLSLPRIWGSVQRKPSIMLSYLDERGRTHQKKFTSFEATIVQHEMDHLDGILFPKRVLEQKNKLYKSRKNEKGEEVFDEIEL